MWLWAAVFSAVFAGITAILSKCGIKNVKSNVATAVRTSVVLIFAWLIALITGGLPSITEITAKSWVFLVLSGLATGASWLCYFKALSLGEVSKVSAVDKSSAAISMLLALIIFPSERVNWQLKLISVVLIAAGSFLMADVKFAKSRAAGSVLGGVPDKSFDSANEQKSGEIPEKTEGTNARAEKTKFLWVIFAVLSAFFAAATSLLAKVGIENVNSNLATAIRTAVVLVFAWIIVFARGETSSIKSVTKKDVVFLVFSGIATGASWLCYYYAVQNGAVSVVVPIDKLSILITVLFSVVFLKEKLSLKEWIGLALLVCGAVLAAFA